MSRGFLFLSGLILVIAASNGCSSISKATDPVSDIPSWVNGPSLFEHNGYIYALGSSPAMRNASLAATTAGTLARTSLLSFLDAKPMVDGRRYTENNLVNSEICAVWRDNKNRITHALARWKIPEK